MTRLESALAQVESDTESALKAAREAVSLLRKVHGVAKVGKLKDFARYLNDAEQAIERLREKLATTRQRWNFDTESYLSDGSFLSEIVETAKRQGLKTYELDGQVYCYPSLMRVAANDQILFIDRQKHTHLRPSVVVDHLKALRNRPVRFRSEPFLKALKEAYDYWIAKKRPGRCAAATPAPLAAIYSLLTPLPGQAKEYSKQEFARDLYLLDEDVADAPAGFTLHSATGRELPARVFSVVTKDGEMKRYYAISFDRDE